MYCIYAVYDRIPVYAIIPYTWYTVYEGKWIYSELDLGGGQFAALEELRSHQY